MKTDNVQIIVCVETNTKAQTDRYYIRKIFDKYLQIGNHKLSFVYMEGKHQYVHPSIKKKITQLMKEFSLTSTGKNYVIMCFDKDKNMLVSQDSNFVDEVTKYCEDNGYLLAWFVSNIEDVMWGKVVSSKDKVKMAEKFITTSRIDDVPRSNLSARQNVNARHKSNILTELRTIPEILKPKTE